MADTKLATHKISNDDFIKRWWKKRFPTADEPNWCSTITCADASDLLDQFRKALAKSRGEGR
jgi:hypothetical protein